MTCMSLVKVLKHSSNITYSWYALNYTKPTLFQKFPQVSISWCDPENAKYIVIQFLWIQGILEACCIALATGTVAPSNWSHCIFTKQLSSFAIRTLPFSSSTMYASMTPCNEIPLNSVVFLLCKYLSRSLPGLWKPKKTCCLLIKVSGIHQKIKRSIEKFYLYAVLLGIMPSNVDCVTC